MRELDFEPVSPREALLAIKFARLGQEDLTADPDFDLIVAYADAGLSRRSPANFELSDQLADRLAKALKVLSEVRESGDVAALSGDINECLVLPPDIEAMVERRVGRID